MDGKLEGETETPESGPTVDAIRDAIEILERLAEERARLGPLSSEDMRRLIRAAGRIAVPDRMAKSQLRLANRNREKTERQRRKAADHALLSQTGIRSQDNPRQYRIACPPEPFEPDLPPQCHLLDDEFIQRLNDPRSCYICKRDFLRVHRFYDSLCPDCAALNWSKRQQTADLAGRYALITGGRVKIGFQAALKLLRAGAHVVVTTRFPVDAARRFLAEDDAHDWEQRLELHGIDLRHTPSVEALADHLVATLPQLDFLLNNACQTVRRPPGFYAHLMEGERTDHALSKTAQRLLQSNAQLKQDEATSEQSLPATVHESLAGIQRAAELSQIPLVPEDHDRGEHLFPRGEYDQDLQQVDLRSINSWRLPLADVPTVELLEVQLVNAIAPFILNSRLKPLMLRTPTRDKHIVNVSAMEGVFYRAYKTDKHPHTNMAKAALNMLTRTSAQDYVTAGIHMNSVDTGWITDEDPVDIAARKQQEQDFYPPLDVIDAAARICDPIFSGCLSGEHQWGQFFKDYQIANW